MRNKAIDILKILSMFFVVVLHVNGYIRMTFDPLPVHSVDAISMFLEALAYPAIHIFVMCTAYLFRYREV